MSSTPAVQYGQGLSFGAPVIGGKFNSVPEGRGQVLYVSQAFGNDANFGFSPGDALATIERAIELASSGTGDIIRIMPGSYEVNVVLDKDYVTLEGCMIGGYARPDIVPPSDSALLVTGQGCVIRHIRMATVDGDACEQQGNGFEYDDCVFDGSGVPNTGGLRLRPNNTDDSLTASEGKVHDCYFRGCTNAIIFDTAAPAVGVGSTDNWIYNNRFSGNTLDIATADSGPGLYSVHTTIIGPGNQFEDKNKATYIDLTTTNGGAAADQTGAINGNYFACDFGVGTAPTTTQIKMVGTGFTFTGNYGTIGLANGSGLD